MAKKSLTPKQTINRTSKLRLVMAIISAIPAVLTVISAYKESKK